MPDLIAHVTGAIEVPEGHKRLRGRALKSLYLAVIKEIQSIEGHLPEQDLLLVIRAEPRVGVRTQFLEPECAIAPQLFEHRRDFTVQPRYGREVGTDLGEF